LAHDSNRFAVRLYGLLAVLALVITAKSSLTVFVTTAIIVTILTVVFAVGVVILRRHFARYPMDTNPA
jgi:Flp pilus assembly protein protease CpaA